MTDEYDYRMSFRFINDLLELFFLQGGMIVHLDT